MLFPILGSLNPGDKDAQNAALISQFLNWNISRPSHVFLKTPLARPLSTELYLLWRFLMQCLALFDTDCEGLERC